MNTKIKSLCLGLAIVLGSNLTVLASTVNYNKLDYNSSMVSYNNFENEGDLVLKCLVKEGVLGANIELDIKSIDKNKYNNLKYYQFYQEGRDISIPTSFGESTTVFPAVKYGDNVELKLLDINKKVIKSLDIKLEKEIIIGKKKPKPTNNKEKKYTSIKEIKEQRKFVDQYKKNYKLPEYVYAKMTDGNRKVKVVWNKYKVDTSKAGKQIFYGTVSGYDKKVKLTLTVRKVDNYTPSYKIKVEEGYFSSETRVEIKLDVESPQEFEVYVNGNKFSYNNYSKCHYETIRGSYTKEELNVKIYRIDDIKIKEIDDIFVKIIKGNKYELPKTIKAKMKDGTIKDVNVTWSPKYKDSDKTVNINISGSYNFIGTVDNFPEEVELQVFVRENNNPLAIRYAYAEYGNYYSTGVTKNSIGTPEANIIVRNFSSKEIDAFEITFKCYDSFGRPVNKWLGKSNVFNGIAQEISISSGESDVYTWNLSLYDLATKIKDIKITKVHFTDGTTWTR